MQRDIDENIVGRSTDDTDKTNNNEANSTTSSRKNL